MRVTFVCVNYSPSIGGAQRYVQRVAEGLAALGDLEIEVLTTNAVRPPAGRSPGRVGKPDGMERGVMVRRVASSRRLHSVNRNVRRLRRRLWQKTIAATPGSVGPLGWRWRYAVARAGRRSDVLVGVSAPFTTISLVAAQGRSTVRRRAHMPLTVAVPLLHLPAGEPPTSIASALQSADHVVACTSYEGAWLIDHGVDTRSVSVIPPGTDVPAGLGVEPREARRRLGLPDRPTIGAIGRLAPHKGIDTLLAAAERLWEVMPELTVLIAGASTGWDGLDRLLAEAEPLARGRLEVRRDFSTAEAPLLMAACDVVAFPSREESFGMVTIEAWAARRPVVAGDIGAVRSFVQPGVDAELVPVGRPQALADAAIGLLGDPERATIMGAAGHARVEAEFAWPQIVDRWDRMLAGLLEGSGNEARALR